MDAVLHSLERRVAYTMVDVHCMRERTASWSNMSTADCPYSTPYVQAIYGRGTHRTLNDVKKTISGAAHRAAIALKRLHDCLETNPDLAQIHIDSQIHALNANLKYISDLLRVVMVMQWGENRTAAVTLERFESLRSRPMSFFSFSSKTSPILFCKTT
jgi:hypothetical protein